MPALQWLDFSSSERDEVLTLLASQKDKSTVDELGIGPIRDAISEHFFPGINTIQTRAKYFLFVPWLLRDLERGNVRDDRLVLTLRQREVSLIDALLATEDEKAQVRNHGLIGRESRDSLKRFPSAIYWNGLRKFRIFQGDGSLEEYLADLPSLREQRRGSRSADAEVDSVEDDAHRSWDPGLPDKSKNLLEATNFALDRNEAQYLKEKILGLNTPSGRRHLIQWMVTHLDAATLWTMESPWNLLDESGGQPALPEQLRTELLHARNFALIIRVLTAVYCLLLAGRRQDLDAERFDEILVESLGDLAKHANELRAWHDALPAFWTWIGNLGERQSEDRCFVGEWMKILSQKGFEIEDPSVLASRSMERWVKSRERRLKGGLARLGNKQVLGRWNAPDRVDALDYRWRTARQIVCDILVGLGRTGEKANARP